MRARPLLLLLGPLLASHAGPALAQEGPAKEAREGPRLVVDPPSLTIEVGAAQTLRIRVEDASGQPLERDLLFYSRSGGVEVDAAGEVRAHAPGEHEVVVRTVAPDERPATARVKIQVPYPPLKSASFLNPDGTARTRGEFVEGADELLVVRVLDAQDLPREGVHTTYHCDPETVATVDAFGLLSAISPGEFTVLATVDDPRVEAERQGPAIETVLRGRVVANPVARIHLSTNVSSARTGDVVPFAATCLDRSGSEVEDAPVRFSVASHPDDDLGPPATAQVEADGRFVAERPGFYTVTAACGNVAAQRTLRVEPREVQARIELVGRGEVHDVHTSDLWVWEGADGRDYAVTGTWGGNGEAHFWDVTDPAHIERVHTVTVDARTVNDVKVSRDGRLCVISREGASNRRNGIVLIDVTDPRRAAVVSTFDDGLTGGVHNLFIWEGHVLALSAGRRYDIIDVRDVENPRRVSTFELDTPGHSIHDVWVVDGIAYSSNWDDGVVLVDVGNGVAGGSLESPVLIGSYAYPSGWNHAAFPYDDAETGKKWVIAGDEAFPYGLNLTDHPTYPRGWLHFIDFTDAENPKEVARYEVPEAGTHNFWVEDDLLYVAYYNGGLRVVDLSGDLLGDLYRQGREVGWFLPTDPEGVIPNASMVWGPQPHKGTIFFSDWNTGLWAVRLDRDGME